MTASRGRRLLPLLAVLLALVATACSGVPTSSSPQVVRTLGLGETPAAQAPSPPAGADPRRIVQLFLGAMTFDPDRHDAARAYLTSDAAQKWTDTTVAVVRSTVVGLFDPTSSSVTVTYQQVGSVSADGIYSPTLGGTGVADPYTATFTLTQVDHQWRIKAPVPPGLLLLESDFAQTYSPRPLYFLDSQGTRLVPDLRYSALTDPSLDTFLLSQLVAGPRPELANAVTNYVPAQSGGQRAAVKLGAPTVVQLPGAAALARDARVRLAAQVSATFRGTVGSSLEVQDGTQTVSVPGVGNPFDASAFPTFATIPPASVSSGSTVTFVRDGAVLDGTGKPVGGALGSGRFGLTTAAIDRSTGTTLVAGTAGPDGAQQLLVGDGTTMTAAGLPPGRYTRPTWAPRTGEVWVASGSSVYRVQRGKPVQQVQATSRTGPVTGTIEAMSFSPEGARLALVVRSPDGASSQVWVASVVTGPDVRLDQLEPVTPIGITLDDVGWADDDTTLLAVGTDATHPAGAFWSLRVDGSKLDAFAPDGLPDRPRTIAVTPTSAQLWVTVGTGAGATVWTSTSPEAGTWTPPGQGPSELGSAPSYSS